VLKADPEFLQSLVARCTAVLDNEDDSKTPDERAKIAAFRDELNAVLDAKFAKA
jgi:hypothetical protein